MQSKQLIFQAQNATPAPWILQSSDLTNTNILVANLQVEESGDLYRNRQILQNANATQTETKFFTGDTVTRTWNMTYPVASGTHPFITLNLVPQTLGIKGVDTGKQFYYQPGSTSIDQDTSQTVLSELDHLEITSTGAYLADVVRDNTGGFPGTTSQSQYAAIDSTSGIVENVIDLSQDPATANMTVADAQVYGDSLLQRYGVIGRTVTFQTIKTGLAIGQQLPAFIPAFGINDVQLLVSQVDLTEKIAMIGGVATVQYWYAVTAVEGPALDSWQKVFGALVR